MNFTDFVIILDLVIIEGLLSFDNALVLAALVKSKLKDPVQQKRALFYGILGAYVMRTTLIFIGVWLMQYEWIKAVAGLYLVYLAVYELFMHKKTRDKDLSLLSAEVPSRRKTSVFLFAVLQIELMDLMFSIDSIAVTLALSNKPWVLVTGAVLGILMMRVAARFFIRLIEHFPLLQPTAYILVGFAGLNIILKLKNLNLGFTVLTIDKAIPEGVFLTLLVVIIIAALVLSRLFAKKEKA